MKNKIITILVLVIIAVISAFIVLHNGSKESAVNSTRNVSVRLAWVPDMAEAGIFVAQEKGYYEEAGLNMTIKPGGFGLDPLKLVASGSDTFGVGGAGNLILAREQGVPIVAIAAEFQHTPVGFITKADSGILTFKDFKGKRVGIQTGADTDVLYRALLSYNGMTEKDVTEVPIQYDMTSFVAGKIDVLPGYVSNQPVTLASQGIKTHVITAKSEGINMYGNVYFVSEKTLADPDLVRAFLAATKKGWEFVLHNKEETVSIMMQHVEGVSRQEMEEIYERVMPFVKPDSKTQLLGMDKSEWESTYDVLKAAGMNRNDIKVEDVYVPLEN